MNQDAMTARGEPVELTKIALLVIDVQMAFAHRDATGAPRSTPLAEGNITRLLDWFRNAGVERLILCGATANQCVESTARMAGNLGFDTFFVSDSVWAYDNTGPDGRQHSADDVLSVTISNLHGEFATIRSTDEVLALLGS